MAGAEPPGRGMRFAEWQLERHGWRPGQGLGKREDGIAEAIRVKMKCDTAGVGHDVAEPFSFHWWDHVFNKAAANIAVETGQDGVSVKALSEQGIRISNKKPRKADSAATMLYGCFVKSATLTACGEESTKLPVGSESSEEEEKLDLSSARRLTDEELMRACGGRTAHKGARHGLTMSAKLARLEEQERAFLAAYHHKERQQEPLKDPTAGRQEKRKKKKRKLADPEVLQNREPGGEEEVVGEEGKVRKRKKKKNQEPSREEEVEGEEGKVRKKKKEPCGEKEVEGEEGKVRKKKKEPCRQEEVEGEEEEVVKRKKNQEASGEEEVEGKEGKAAKRNKKQQQKKEEPVETKKDRKKKKEEEDNNKEPAETEVLLEDTDGPEQTGHSLRKTKKKKKRRKREPE